MQRKGSIITLIVVFGIIGLVYLLIFLTPESPKDHLERARIAVAEARKNQSESYANQLFQKTVAAYEQAVVLWESENKRFFILRDYDKIDSFCVVAIANANEAILMSIHNSQNLESSLKARITNLQAQVDKYGELMSKVPVSKQTRQNFLNGKMMLSEALIEFQKQHFTESDVKARDAGKLISVATSSLESMLTNYFDNYPNWIKWVDLSIKKSKSSHAYLVVVDKMSRACMVYKNGKLKKTYSIELGKNWIGDKRQNGDKTTPEGIYMVKKKLDTRNTKYYKALLLNYPNEDDISRFHMEKKNGTLSAHADIGGLIEIHGHGGKGVDWTDGCIALKDDDMKELFQLIEVSTPVTIVGSLKPLNEILKN